MRFDSVSMAMSVGATGISRTFSQLDPPLSDWKTRPLANPSQMLLIPSRTSAAAMERGRSPMSPGQPPLDGQLSPRLVLVSTEKRPPDSPVACSRPRGPAAASRTRMGGALAGPSTAVQLSGWSLVRKSVSPAIR